MACRFILSDIDERQVTAEDGYSILDATATLEIDRRNMFHSVKIEGAKPTVIMHSREQWTNETLDMIEDIRENPGSNGEYSFWMYGTGFGFKLRRNGDNLRIHLEVNSSGPTQRVRWPQTIQVGTVSSKDWIEAIVSIPKELASKFLRLNTEAYHDLLFQRQERKLAEIGRYLGAG